MFFFFLLFCYCSTLMTKDPLLLTKDTLINQGLKAKNVTESWKFNAQLFPLTEMPEWFYNIPGAYVIELTGATLYSDNGIVLYNGKIYQDSLWTWSALYKSPNDLFPIPAAIPIQGKVATIALEGKSNYYHWMTEILPRLALLQQSHIEYDFLYVPKIQYQFQKDTLKLLGVDYEKIIEGVSNTHIQPTTVIFPSQVARSCITPAWVVEFLQKWFLQGYQVKNGKKRIFISRGNAAIRRILNEDAIFEIIKPFGFEKVLMEKMSVIEQAQLAHEAEFIIGTHGAGMTNIVFARPNTTIIELFQEHLDQTFFDLSTTMNLTYYCIKTERIPELSEESVDIRFRNTYINIDLIKKGLIELFERLQL